MSTLPPESDGCLLVQPSEALEILCRHKEAIKRLAGASEVRILVKLKDQYFCVCRTADNLTGEPAACITKAEESSASDEHEAGATHAFTLPV